MPPPSAKPGLKQGPDPTAPLDPSALERASSDELAVVCGALEDELEELKAKYEMYFLGVELREPGKWREELKKQVLRLKEAFTRNTGLRFRIQTLHARFLSYERLWQRAAREREEGTYRRDIEKAKRHARGAPVTNSPVRKPKRAGGKPLLADEDVDLSDFSGGDAEEAPRPVATPRPGALPAAARAAPPPTSPPSPGSPPTAGLPRPGTAPAGPVLTPPAATPVLTPPPKPRAPRVDGPPTLQRVAPTVTPPPRAAPPAPSAPRLGEAQMRELYDAYVTAKKRCNEDVSRLSFDAVARSVSKQIPEIMQQHKARSVEFKVVIKNGKARLTAVPKL